MAKGAAVVPEIDPEAVQVPSDLPASATAVLSFPEAVLVPSERPTIEFVATVRVPVAVLVPGAVPASCYARRHVDVVHQEVGATWVEPPQEKFTAHASLANVYGVVAYWVQVMPSGLVSQMMLPLACLIRSHL